MDAPAEPFSDRFRAALEERLLAAWIPRRRWFRSKSRAPASVAIEAAIPVMSDAAFCVVRVTFTRGDAERYAVPLLLVPPERAAEFPNDAIAGEAPDGRVFIDAVHAPDFRAALRELLAGRREAAGFGGLLRGRPDSPGDFAGLGRGARSRLYAGEQSNTSFSCDDRVAVKIYRRVEAGIHPEPEMLRFLRRAGYRGAPRFLSALEWLPEDGARAGIALALAQEFVRDAEGAWDFAVNALAGALEASRAPLPAALAGWAARLGTCVGELHAALAARPDDPDFAPEALAGPDLAAARAGSLARLDATAHLLGEEAAARLREKLLRAAPAGVKIRVHGDLHLGQILLAAGGPRVLDFEGEPGRPLAEARRKVSPLRDAAGMLRSFHYAAHVAARRAPRSEGSQALADTFAHALGTAFRAAYFRAAEAARLFPARAGDDPEISALLNFFILEKALYELGYERDNRPDWIDIPLRGLRMLAG